MSHTVHTEAYKNLTITIEQDQDAENPFTSCDGEPEIIGWHRHYCYNTRDSDRKKSPSEFAREAKEGRYIVKALYMYDHSGVSFSTSRTGQFADQWDSGQFGFIFWTPEKIAQGQGEKFAKRITKKRRAMLEAQLDSACDLLNDYSSGNVYGYSIENKEGETLDSCWGFWGDWEGDHGALAEAKSQADYYAGQEYEKEARDIEATRPDMYATPAAI